MSVWFSRLLCSLLLLLVSSSLSPCALAQTTTTLVTQVEQQLDEMLNANSSSAERYQRLRQLKAEH